MDENNNGMSDYYNFTMTNVLPSNNGSSVRTTTGHDLHVIPTYLVTARYAVFVLAVVSAYITVALIVHKWRNRTRVNVAKTNHLCLLSAIVSFLLCLNKVGELWLPLVSCKAYHWSAAALYGIGSAVVYIILWARQRTLYSSDLLARNVSSSVVIVGICCFLAVICIVFETTYRFKSSYKPCIVIWHKSDALVCVVSVFVVTCLLFQFLLWILIVTPLVGEKRKKSMYCQLLLCPRLENDIHRMVKRLAYCACACVFSSTVLSVTILLDSMSVTRLYWGSLIALDLVVNTIATTCTFADWRQRLLPMIQWNRTPPRPNNAMVNSIQNQL